MKTKRLLLKKYINVCRIVVGALMAVVAIIIVIGASQKYLIDKIILLIPEDKFTFIIYAVFGVVVYLLLLYLSFHLLYKIITVKVKERLGYGRLLVTVLTLNLLVIWGVEYLPVHNSNIFQRHFYNTKELEFLKNMDSVERIEVLYGTDNWLAVENELDQYYGFNIPMFYKINIAGGSHQLHSARYRIYYDMMNLRYPFDPSFYWENGQYVRPSARVYLEKDNIDFDKLNLLSVKYLFSPREREESFLKLALKGDNYYIYENTNALDRCFIVGEYEMMDEGGVINSIYRGTFNPRKKVLLEGDIKKGAVDTKYSNEKYVRDSKCTIINYKANEVLIKYNSPRGGILVLTDSYAKGWKAYIDDVETQIFRANYLFRGIVVPEGANSVRFQYYPVSFQIGLIVSVSGLVICIITLFYCRRKMTVSDPS